VRSVACSAGIAAVVAGLLLTASPAQAAFPGRNGLLAVQEPGGNVALVTEGGRFERQLCTVTALCGTPVQPRFSPDGRRLVVTDAASSRIEILGVDGTCLWCLEGTPLTALTGSRPAFTANGLTVTFSRGPSGAAHGEWTVALTGGAATPELAGRVSDGVWSSTGELAFVRAGAVWVRGAGRHPHIRRLSSGAAPSWSPNGSELAIARGGWVWLVRVRGGRARRLTAGGAPSWSPDGRLIAYIGRGGGVRLIGAGGGRSRSLGLDGRAIDWQPLPRKTMRACVTPKGDEVVAGTAQAVIVSNPTNGGWHGCLRGVGRWRTLASGSNGDAGYYTTLTASRLAGRFALVATSYGDKYGDCSLNSGVTDLASGASIPLVDQACGGATSSAIDSFVLSSSGFAAWRSSQSVPLYEPLAAVSCASVSLCVAGDQTGDVLTATNPGGGRSAWSLAAVAPEASLGSVSCPTDDFCAAAAGGKVFASTNPTAGATAWTASTPDPQAVPIFQGEAISCPSASLCVVADGSGNISTSTDPTDSAPTWDTAHVGAGSPPSLGTISCPSTSLCVALDDHGDVVSSTDPTGGASAWTTTPISSWLTTFSSPADVSCASTPLCVAVAGNRILTSTDPSGGAAAWTVTTLTGSSSLTAVSCPSTSLCVAVDNQGNVYTSSDPTGGASAWQSANVDGSNALDGVSCASASQCVAVDGKGNVLSSAAPAGGASAWSTAAVDVPDCAVQGTPCIGEKLFVHDDHGTSEVDSAAPGSGKQLRNVSLSGDGLVLSWTHDGLPEQLPLG
jgi:WD40-like Beta Propeller Repeat